MLLNRLNLQESYEVTDGIATFETCLLEEYDFDLIDYRKHALEELPVSDKLHREDLYMMIGKQPLDLEVLIKKRIADYRTGPFHTLHKECRHIFDDIDHGYLGCPFRDYVLQVVMKWIQTKLYRVLQ